MFKLATFVDRFLEMKLSAAIVFYFFCKGGAFKLCSLHIYTERQYIWTPLFCKLDGFNEATEEFLLLNFLFLQSFSGNQ